MIFDTEKLVTTGAKNDKMRPLLRYSKVDLQTVFTSSPVVTMRMVQAKTGTFAAVSFAMTVNAGKPDDDPKKLEEEAAAKMTEHIANTFDIGVEDFDHLHDAASGSTFHVYHNLAGPRKESNGKPKLCYHTYTLFLKLDKFEPR